MSTSSRSAFAFFRTCGATHPPPWHNTTLLALTLHALRIPWINRHNMAWSTTTTTIIEYKTRPRMCPDEAHTAPLKPLDNDMPSSPVPFITPSSLVTFQHGLKAYIISSPLLKLPLTMRPLIKKNSSAPFTLNLKRHSTTIFSRPSSSSSEASTSTNCTPTSEMADPICMVDVSIDSPSSIQNTPCIGAKILDRFWPEEEESYSEESCRHQVPSCYPVALAPPPHHRRSPRPLAPVRGVPISDPFPPQSSSEHDTGSMRFPF